MWPENKQSSTPVPANFFGARARAVSKVIDYEDGGIAINDPSRGLLFQTWRALRDKNKIFIDAPNTPQFLAFEGVDVTDFSFTFDQNMRLVLTYVDEGVAYIEWYDTALGMRVTDVIGSGIITPRVSLDDKRKNQLGISDVILMYGREGVVKYRLQRDRFLSEYSLPQSAPKGLVKIGMLKNLRFGWMIKA